jgi:hypothetical protein
MCVCGIPMAHGVYYVLCLETLSWECDNSPAGSEQAAALGVAVANALRARGAGSLLGPENIRRPITYGSAENAGLTL